LYTSPHLRDFRERVKINGALIPEEEVVRFVERHQESFKPLSLSFFEWTVGLAFWYFAEQEVDIAVVEVGMGGRLDSTNIIYPEVTVITNIGRDHMAYLGNTLKLIAGEKAGIMKKGIPTVIGQTQPEVEQVFLEKAKQLPCPITFADQSAWSNEWESDLKGQYQRFNKRTVGSVVEVMRSLDWKISAEAVQHGLANVVRNTGLLGRWQQLGEQPLIICDTAHNVEGLTATMQQLNSLPHRELHIVFGVVSDKNLDELLDLLPSEAHFYFCSPAIARALPVGELVEAASNRQLKGAAYQSVKSAVEAAKSTALPSDVIYIGGSTFVVAEVV
jgi:dihydrofolate synthase/folylpolyglutamate synthase